MHVPPGVKCSDPNCHNCSHHDDIDDFYDAIMGTLKMSSQSLMSNCKCDFKHAVVPSWNDKVKALHSAAGDAYLIWRAIGKPRQGDDFNAMKLSRTKCKHAIRKCKKDKETTIADSIAEKICQKDPRKFWKGVKHRVNSKTKIPTNVDGVHGDDNIGSMWKHHLRRRCTWR